MKAQSHNERPSDTPTHVTSLTSVLPLICAAFELYKEIMYT